MSILTISITREYLYELIDNDEPLPDLLLATAEAGLINLYEEFGIFQDEDGNWVADELG